MTRSGDSWRFPMSGGGSLSESCVWDFPWTQLVGDGLHVLDVVHVRTVCMTANQRSFNSSLSTLS